MELTFEENETRIAELEETLRERLGTLGELFGVVRQVAGDTRGQIENSLVSSQIPGREEFLTSWARARRCRRSSRSRSSGSPCSRR